MNPFDQLFNRWEKKYQDELFVRDGIINESAWLTARWRIVFLLKENNCAPGSVSAKAPLEYQKDFCLLGNKYPWREIGQWAYGLLRLPSKPSFAEADRHFEAAFRQIAIVNLKKTAGGNSSSSTEIARHARQDKDLLKEQLTLLSPRIVVCCGKDLVFSLAREILEDAAGAQEIGPSLPVAGCRTPVRLLGRPGGWIWLDFVHPSMRRGSRENKYGWLMDLCGSTSF